MSDPVFSLIIPVYNRPEELSALLKTLENQSFMRFELIVVDDGSKYNSQGAASGFAPFPCRYFYTKNRGPGPARNFGAQQARGTYLLFLDSDTLLPPTYLSCLHARLQATPLDFFGGPDRAAADFSPFGKAIDYTMTSLLTTGGIRGGKTAGQHFQPRSFNMGIRSLLFDRIGGFAPMRVSEDIDLVLRAEKAGAKGALIPEAWVYHKRRATLCSFFRQTYTFGHGRVFLDFFHHSGLKYTFWLPALYVLGVLSAALALLIGAQLPLGVLLCYWLLVGLGAAWKTRSTWVGLLAVAGVNAQFFGYALGFLHAYYRVKLLKQPPQRAFPHFFRS